MAQAFRKLGGGPDFTLPTAPALTEPPLTLLDLSRELVNIEQLADQLRHANEEAASAQAAVVALESEGDTPGEPDSDSDAGIQRKQMLVEWQDAADRKAAFASDLAERLAALTRWENGLEYLPELSNAAALSLYMQGGAGKDTGSNQTAKAWYDAFTVVGRDDRSAFGWPATDFASRALRAKRALQAHRTWQVEEEFWNGAQVPTNYHLTASPQSPTTTPGVRTCDPYPNPSSPGELALGTPVTFDQSLSYLDQAIADSEAGTGMIHASPLLVQQWMQAFNYIRDSDGKVYTVNHNLIVPGYGYSGQGPDVVDLDLADVVLNSTNTVTSVTGWNVDAYVGRPISGPGIPPGAVLGKITDANTATLYAPDPVSGLYSPVNATESATVAAVIKGIGGRRTWDPKQWAYATEQTYSCLGDQYTYPDELNQTSPQLTVDNSIDVRVEQPAGVLTNRILRLGVYVEVFIHS